jgi:hypothetical protein
MWLHADPGFVDGLLDDRRGPQRRLAAQHHLPPGAAHRLVGEVQALDRRPIEQRLHQLPPGRQPGFHRHARADEP